MNKTKSPVASQFNSLTAALTGWFDKTWAELPKALRDRLETDFPLPWDALSPEQRRMAAEQSDYQHDPATEQERQQAWDIGVARDELVREIEDLERMAATTPTERESKTRQLADLRRRLKRVTAAARVPQSRKDVASSPGPDPSGNYVHFLKARDALKDRLGATSEEIAIWVWLGSEAGGLAAWKNAPLYGNSPPRFHFSEYDGNPGFVPELMHCYFKSSDIESFMPRDRYLTYVQVLDRWRPRLAEQDALALLQAKVATGALDGFHPLSGGVQEGVWAGQGDFPPIEYGMFWLAQVEAVEAECFPCPPGGTGKREVSYPGGPTSVDYEYDENLGESVEPEPQTSSSPQEIDRAKPVSKRKIVSAFKVTAGENDAWWDERMRDAKRYGLLGCRAAKGGAGKRSLWHPDLVAAWLVDKKHLDAKTVARVLRAKFIDCGNAADLLDPSGT